jgi:hypothetical protein
MKLVVVESPFGRNTDGSVADAATIERNVRYVRAAMADCFARGEAPYASHALYTQPGILDDSIPDERRRGMFAGFEWGANADIVAVYADHGITPGMKDGIERARIRGQRIEYRSVSVP